jgi:cardiolipin synthase A/B
MIGGLYLLLLAYVATWAVIPLVLLSRKRPSSMVAWLGAIILLPFLGALLFFFFGTDRLRRKRLERRSDRARSRTSGSEPDFDFDANERALVRAVALINRNPLSAIDKLELLHDNHYFDALYAGIEKAEHHIHFQTYVWRDDETGRRFLAALVRAARRGVAVRLLVDELGSFETKDALFRPLIEAGGEFSWFYTLHPRRNRFFLNLRNHRKLQIIDGASAWVGGMNIGREYQGRDPEVGDWHDLQMRLSGPAVADLQDSFLHDWFFATRQRVDPDTCHAPPPGTARQPALLVESGPDSTRQPFLKSAVAVCNFARESVDLFTPYFVPVNELVTAMQIAAARGVRVRLMVSEKNDHNFLVKIGRSYYEQLMDFGVEIYEYGDAVHHAKVIIADRRWLMVGSANLDARSIDLNFETNLLIRCPETCAQLEQTYEPRFGASHHLELEKFRNRPQLQKLAEGLSRLWSPLL